MSEIKVGIALSGGVDSTSTALLLKEHYNVTGFFMQLAQPELAEQTEQVISVSKKIGIPLEIIDLRESFEKRVLEYFSRSYFSGLTPNPCVVCNREIKFGLFLDAILAAGMDKMATGHYARIERRSDGYHLFKGKDKKKDQSYFLSRLDQQQLSRILFPLGERKKTDIYDLVENYGFQGFRGKESQDVCFLKDTKVSEFLRSRTPGRITQGKIVNEAGEILGSHNGIANYTVGQRRGLGISAPKPYYVIRLDAQNNTVVVGEDDELLRENILVHKLHLLSGANEAPPGIITIKIRSTHSGCEGCLDRIDEQRYQLQFSKPQRAVTPGQYAVFYQGDELLGSAEII